MSPGKFAIEYVQGAWHVKLPDQEGNGIRIDQAVVDASFISKDFVEGRIRAVHGLDFELASRMNMAELASLGVRAVSQLSPKDPRYRNQRLVRLMEDGSIRDMQKGGL